MSNYKTQAINIKSYNLGETDRIMVMYSRDHGIIRCVAKGAKKPASKLGGRMQALVANKLLIAKGKNLDIVQQAELVDGFKELRNDISKLTYAMYAAEIINSFGLENDTNSAEVYDIFFEGLKNICLASAQYEVLWAVLRFNILMLEELGYAIETETCVKCHEKVSSENLYFCGELGGVMCKACRAKTYASASIASSKGQRMNVPNIVDVDPKLLKIIRDARNFDFPDESTYNNKNSNELLFNTCFGILRKYTDERLHKKLKTPDLIECLC